MAHKPLDLSARHGDLLKCSMILYPRQSVASLVQMSRIIEVTLGEKGGIRSHALVRAVKW